MPSPLGHLAAALALHVTAARENELTSLRSAAVIAAAALAPDLDLLLRYVDGRNHHQAESHSVGCALMAGLAVWAFARWRRWPRPHVAGALAAAGWLSHVALDYLGRDTHPPIGVLALWPISQAYFKFPWPVFLDIGRTLSWEALRHNARAIAWELALLLPPLLWLWRRRLRPEG